MSDGMLPVPDPIDESAIIATAAQTGALAAAIGQTGPGQHVAAHSADLRAHRVAFEQAAVQTILASRFFGGG